MVNTISQAPVPFTNPQGTVQFAGGILGQDWKKVAEQSLAREQKKIDTLKKEISQKEIQNKAIIDLKNKLITLNQLSETLQGGSDPSARNNIFEAKNVTISPSPNPAFGAHVSSGASIGSYNVNVQQIALAHKFRSDAQASGTTALNLTGSLVLATSADGTQNPITITVNAVDSLADIATSINQSGSYLSATVLDVDDTHHYLNITDKNTGETIYIANTSTSAIVTGLGLGTVSGPDFVVKNLIQANQPSIIQIDGQAITRTTNVIGDVLAGVIFELYTPSVGSSTIAIETDVLQIKNAIKSFVDQYNDIRETINKNHQVDENGKPTAEAPLYRSALLDLVDMTLESVLQFTTIGAPQTLNTLHAAGISAPYDPFSKQSLDQGKLSIDDAILDAHLITHLDQIRSLFTFTWTSSHPSLSVTSNPNTIKDLPGGMTLDFTVTDGVLTQVQNNKGFTTQINENAITFTSGEATGLVLYYAGGASVNGVQFTYQTGLFHKLGQTLDGWITYQTGLFDQNIQQSNQENILEKKDLTQAESIYKTKLQNQIQKYTKMETEYARIQQILQKVQQMQASWSQSR